MAFPAKQTASPTQGYQQKNVHDMKASRIYMFCFENDVRLVCYKLDTK